jgi:glutaredoxin
MAFVVYTRRGCHLCEVLVEQLLETIGPSAKLELRDIDTDASWYDAFSTRVPVLEYNGKWVCDYRLDVDRLRTLMAELPNGE